MYNSLNPGLVRITWKLVSSGSREVLVVAATTYKKGYTRRGKSVSPLCEWHKSTVDSLPAKL